MLTASILTIAAVTAQGQGTFNYIRLGDIDGMGFVTGTDPCGAEPCWPFQSPFDLPPNCPLDGSCSNGVLINAAGNPINVDGIGILSQGDFLPDLDCSVPGCDYPNYGCHYNSDEFDNREPNEVNGLVYGTYTELSGASDINSQGSGWTDVAVSGTGVGWNNCFDAPSSGYVCGQGQPTFVFQFDVTGADPTQPVYINAVFGDYDVDSANDTVLIRLANGTTQQLSIATQNNGAGQDGMIQMATATVPFSSVFTNWPSNTQGYLEVEFQMPSEPFVAYDYVEIGVTPLVQEEGCCCYQTLDGTWQYTQMTQDKCMEVMGYYQGDGVECDEGAPTIGACCILAGNGNWVCEDTADCECDFQGGTFYPLYECWEIDCEPVQKTGCCCYEDQESGLWFLAELTPQKCEALGGNFAGVGVPCETDVSPMGACCIEEPSGYYCFETSQCNCEVQGGQFFIGLDCTNPEVPCNTGGELGACCHYDRETGCPDCVVTTLDDCVESGSYIYPQWQGAGTTCDDADLDCCQPSGACCLGNACVWTIQKTCDEAQGTWHATATCDQVNCTYCPGDLDGNGSVDINDLLAIINQWGPCP